MERLEINNRIGKLRSELGLSGREFAEKLGVTRSTVNNWETGGYNVKADDIEKICNTFNVSADWLIGISDVKNPETTVQAIHNYTGLSEQAIDVLHNMNREYRSYLMRLFEDPSIEVVGGYISFADWSVTHADTSDRKPWSLTDGDDISFHEDGSIHLSAKEAAKSHIDRATRHIGKILESSIINAWNHPELYMEGDSNAKESKQESER